MEIPFEKGGYVIPRPKQNKHYEIFLIQSLKSQTMFQTESPKNFQQKTICCFVLDVSGSMDGDPINKLNAGVKSFFASIVDNPTLQNQLEVAIVEFSDDVEISFPPALIDDQTPVPHFRVKGTTKLVDGVQEAISLVSDRKDWYKQTGQPYLRPWIILITDGAPDSDQDVDALSSQIESSTRNSQFIFLPLGVDGADFNMLRKIAGYVKGPNDTWLKMDPLKIDGLKFEEFFKWVSASMEKIASSKEGDVVSTADPSAWMKGLHS